MRLLRRVQHGLNNKLRGIKMELNLPWRLNIVDGRQTIQDKKDGFPLTIANAEFIVSACNSHDALKKAMHQLLENPADKKTQAAARKLLEQ